MKINYTDIMNLVYVDVRNGINAHVHDVLILKTSYRIYDTFDDAMKIGSPLRNIVQRSMDSKCFRDYLLLTN
jgi:hypothetical protein